MLTDANGNRSADVLHRDGDATNPDPTPSPWPGPFPPPGGPSDAPRVATVGNAAVTCRFDGGRLTVTLDVGAHMVVTNEGAARDLYAALAAVFDPLASTQAAVRRSVALAGDAR